MKKILLPLAACAFIMSACDNTPKFTINGTVEGDQTGNVFLIQEKNRALDTLAKSTINNGKFTLKGQVDSIAEAFIVIEGKENFSLMFVENATYTANLDANDPMKNRITGTNNQDVINQFLTIAEGKRQEMTELSQQYQAATEAKDAAKMEELENQLDQLYESRSTQEDELIKANPDSYVSAFILSMKMSNLEHEALKPLFDGLTPTAQASTPGQRVAAHLAMLAPTAVGQVAPNFTMPTPTGDSISMHSVKGKVKIIDFWASWCAPCRAANPQMVSIYKEFHPKGLEIVGVSLDNDKEAWTGAIKEDKLPWIQISDLQGGNEIANLYGITGIPHTVLVDENNVIIGKNLKGEKLKEKLNELLK